MTPDRTGVKMIAMGKNLIRNIAAAAVLLALSAIARAQDAPESRAKEYAERYNLLVSRLGDDGVGVETVLNNWAAVAPDDIDMLTGRFRYYFAKSQRTEVVSKDQGRFMGAGPVLSLKDSTGNMVNYFQEVFYDDSLYTLSVKYLDRAIREDSDRLDLRLLKATALVAYEKESPDMALAYLEKLADENVLVHGAWEYPGLEMSDTLFCDLIQEYCYTFFNIGSKGSYSAFYRLSGKMLEYYPDAVVFMDNLGSYYLVAENDFKTARKYYDRVLKKVPDDYTAIKNSVLIARRQKNTKQEKKYLQKLVEVSTGTEKMAAEARLKAL